MRIEQLEYLVKIAQMNNMTKAANALHISQPTLSESIKRLEKELDVELLERHHKGVELTESGKCVVNSAKNIFKEINLMNGRLEKIKSELELPRKEIAIDVTPFLGNTYLFQFWKRCRERLNWDINIKLYDARKILERIYSGRSSMGLILIESGTLEEAKAQKSNLNYQLLEKGKVKVLFSKAHPLNAYEKVSINKLSEYPLLFPKNECIPVRAILEKYKKPKSLMESEIYMLPQHFIENDMGVCLLASVLIDYFLNTASNTENVVVKDLDVSISSDLYLVMDKNYADTEMGLACQKEIMKYFSQKRKEYSKITG